MLNNNNPPPWLITVSFIFILFIQSGTSYSLCTSQQSSCLICPIECTRCDQSFTCTACSLGYYLASGQCLGCPQYCISCSSSTLCTQCMPPFVLVNGTCQQCVISNALTCSSTVSASSCQPQYYVNDNYCSSCLLNCKTCTSASTCTACVDYFYLNSTVLTCNPCPANCLSCSQFSPGTCTSCRDGYGLSNGQCTAIQCTISNCLYCNSVNVCGRCQLFYFWDGTQCVMGASVLCDFGANGPLPSHCANLCDQGKYRAETSVNSFLCVPYRTVKIADTKISQIYYYAYSDEKDLRTLSVTINSIKLQPTGQYSYQLSSINLDTIASFYKIQLRLKYLSITPSTMTLTSSSQPTPSTQHQSTILPSTPTAYSLSYLTHTVHSNNLKLTFSVPVSLVELYLTLSKCPDYCLQCLNLELCQLCKAPMYMLGYQCVQNCTVYYHFPLNRTCVMNCPEGYYYLAKGTNDKWCEVCQAPCASCIDQTKCLTCVNGYFFYNYTCKQTCPDGYFKNLANNTCDNCISPCRTCTSKVQCLSCEVGYWNGVKCTMLCAAGTYGNNATQICENCDVNCLTCTNTSTLCTSCLNTLYLHNKQCLANCPVRYYPSTTLHLACLQCSPPCSSCTSPTSCLTCAYNFLYQTKCLGTCPDGFYGNLINNQCTQCLSTCKTCSSGNSCDSCQTGKCLYQGSCVTNCPSTVWYKDINQTTNQCTCTSCTYPCKQCLSSSQCLSCLQGYLQSTSCLTQCPINYHKNDTIKQCILCSLTFANCQQCTQQKCLLCETSYLLYSGTCLSQCPQYFYQSNEKCLKCIAPCLDCSGFSQCKSCITGYVLYNTQCVLSCPQGKFSSMALLNGISQSTCLPCTSPCLSCLTTATTCTFCQSSYYLYQSQCLSNCSTLSPSFTYYNQPITSTCSKCLFPCKTCLSQFQCTSCLIGYLNVNDKKCRQCEVGTYPDNLLQQCKACPQQCVICYSSEFCSSCQDGFYLFMNQCISNVTVCQVNGYYAIGRICTLCQSPCKTCSKSASNCTTCLQGYTMFGTSQCMLQCPNGYFRNSTTAKCNTCAPQCTTCLSSSTYCFTCATSYKLYTAQMKCLATCPAYTYAQNSFCMQCKYPCLQCKSQSQCLSCITGSLVGTQCMSACLSGYFANKLMICQQCTTTCRQCSGSSSNCTQCPSKTYLYNSQCLTVCPSQTFAQQTSQKCIPCMSTCLQCQSYINCTSCSGGLYHYITQITKEGQCVSKCPNGYYPSTQNTNKCLACKSQCLTCADATSCLLCANGNVMYSGECFTECPQKMYSFQGVCEECKAPCYNCSDTTTCTSCEDDSFLLVGSAQCIEGPVCPLGYFKLENQLKCNSVCPSGYYHLKRNRTCNRYGCHEDQFMGVDYQCYEECPEGTVGNTTLYCANCEGSACQQGLWFAVKYEIRNDQLLVRVKFTQTPQYLVSEPTLVISPNISYSLSSVFALLSSSYQQSSRPSEQQPSLHAATKSTSPTTPGLEQLTLNLSPTTSLQQTYFTLSFSSPLKTFANPLQSPSYTFYLEGYDSYDNVSLKDFSNTTIIGLLMLVVALVGLVKNPYMTDFAQLVFVLALNNVHYPLNLRTFLQQGKLAWLNGFLGIRQESMQGNGKFGYVVSDGLVENAFGNVIIIVVGLVIGVIGLVVYKCLQSYLEYGKVSNSASPHQQQFIQHHHTQQDQIDNKNQTKPTTQQQQPPHRSLSHTLLHQLSNIYIPTTFNLHYINRLIYFNYLPITLFTFTQLSHLDDTSTVNILGFVLSILLIMVIVSYPFTLVKTKPKFTFLYARKLVTCLSLILSVNYPAYVIGVLSVCAVTAAVLIYAYKLEKWKVETVVNVIGELMQLVMMVGFAIFVMIGEGYQTGFKAGFGYVLVFVVIAILLFYLLFQMFLFVLWLIKVICKKDLIEQWILQDKLDDSDGTDSETLNSSMKDHQEKKQPLKPINTQQDDDINWNTIENMLKKPGGDDDNFIQGQIRDFVQTRQLGISPTKNQDQGQMQVSRQKQAHNHQLFWNYQTNSQRQQQQQNDLSPPKILIRCINQFSDLDHGQIPHIEQPNNNTSNEHKQ